MIDYKHGTGQKRRLTLTSDATREAVAQAKGDSWGALRANCLARRVVEQPPLLALAGWEGKAFEQSIAGVTSWLQRTAEYTLVGNAVSKLLGAFDHYR